MATIEQSRAKARKERLQAHPAKLDGRVVPGAYIVYNVAKGTEYLVRYMNGLWTCECPWVRKGSRTGTQDLCKHVVRVLDKIAVCASGCPDNVDVRITSSGEALCKRCRYIERMSKP